MEILAALGAWALGTFCASLPADNYGIASKVCRRTDIGTVLGPKLSSGAHIYFPGSTGFQESTDRWSSYKAPNFTIVVEVADENDVAETVKYANANNIPFLAVNGGHGAITTVGKLQHGIEIWLRQLDSVEISVAVSWPRKSQTHFTGGCECVSLLGLGLGGGHGFLQGRYGLVSDQFVSMRVVMADGSIKTVSPSDPYSDLWWAMQGAGHNFGIVTSITSKIYDVKDGGVWSYGSYIFTHDKVEDLYDRLNTLSANGNQPVDLINYSFFFRNQTIDPEKPVIALFILQEGVSTIESTYTAPFRELGAAVLASGSGTYKDLPAWTGNANVSPPCQKNGDVNILRFPIDLQSYSVKAQRVAFDKFARVTSEIPQLNRSMFLFEGYSLQGFKAVPANSTAFPFRHDNLLVAPLIIYESDPKLDATAIAFGEDLRQILSQESGETELRAYVNYAFGEEQPKNWYGYEPWRLEKLKALKDKYDPQRKFKEQLPPLEDLKQAVGVEDRRLCMILCKCGATGFVGQLMAGGADQTPPGVSGRVDCSGGGLLFSNLDRHQKNQLSSKTPELQGDRHQIAGKRLEFPRGDSKLVKTIDSQRGTPYSIFRAISRFHPQQSQALVWEKGEGPRRTKRTVFRPSFLGLLGPAKLSREIVSVEVPCPALAANSARDTAWKDLHDHELAQKDDDSMCSRERSLLATRVALQLESSSPTTAAPTATTFCRRLAVCAKAPKLSTGERYARFARMPRLEQSQTAGLLGLCPWDWDAATNGRADVSRRPLHRLGSASLPKPSTSSVPARIGRRGLARNVTGPRRPMRAVPVRRCGCRMWKCLWWVGTSIDSISALHPPPLPRTSRAEESCLRGLLLESPQPAKCLGEATMAKHLSSDPGG
ncbi:hypothetical protein VTN00DRAFT_298 [Thermoascus crustaceus]|uniref:uncharacterized protein n=1 Tax=Thermoascus crustaceus TaxID=5088 RepID=UPI0037436FC1